MCAFLTKDLGHDGQLYRSDSSLPELRTSIDPVILLLIALCPKKERIMPLYHPKPSQELLSELLSKLLPSGSDFGKSVPQVSGATSPDVIGDDEVSSEWGFVGSGDVCGMGENRGATMEEMFR